MTGARGDRRAAPAPTSGAAGCPEGDKEKAVGPRSSKGQRTRTRLLQAAKEVFEEHGFPEARISDIGERAGLSYGSLYHYFSSKEEIFREVAAAQEQEPGPPVVDDAGLEPDAAGAAVAERMAAANRRYLSEYRGEVRIMGVIEQVSRYDDAVGAARFDRHRRYGEQLAAAVAQLQHRGMADPQIDPVIGSYALTAMVTRFAEAWFIEGQVDCSFDEGVAQLNRLCLNALRASQRPDHHRRGSSR